MGASKLFRQKGNHPSVLVAAMHPYRCSHFRNPKKECRCSPAQVEHYCAKISGPLLDRIDIHVEAPAVEFRDLYGNFPAEPSSAIRQRVLAARERQSRRFARIKNHTNGRISNRTILEFCALDSDSSALLEKAMNELNFSARAYDRILKAPGPSPTLRTPTITNPPTSSKPSPASTPPTKPAPN
jgi:magnesium chelatase family protein